jgi:hypothetical protein
MTGSGIEAWQISLIVTALVVLGEIGVNALLRRDINFFLHRRVRTGLLGALVVLTVIVFVAALGPSLADQLSSVAAGVAAVVALWLTYRSYQAPREPTPAGTGAPAEPAPGVLPPQQVPGGLPPQQPDGGPAQRQAPGGPPPRRSDTGEKS